MQVCCLFALVAFCATFQPALTNPGVTQNEQSNERENAKPLGTQPIGPVVLVTGASGGIGLSLVKQLLTDRSVEVVFAADIWQNEELSKLCDMHADISRKLVVYVRIDIANPDSVEQATQFVRSKLAELDPELKLNTLINNAGIMQSYTENKGVDALTPSKGVYKRHLEINSVGSVLITAAFHELMPADMSGRMVFISSSVGMINQFLGIRNHRNVAYGMSKAALNYYMKAINSYNRWLTMSICPSWVNTQMGQKANSDTTGAISPENAATELHRVIREMMTEKNIGKFYSLHFNRFVEF